MEGKPKLEYVADIRYPLSKYVPKIRSIKDYVMKDAKGCHS